MTDTPDKADEAWPRTVTLTKPITAFEQHFSTLSFREPTAGDVMDHGMDFAAGGDLDWPRLIPLMAALCGKPERSLRTLAVRDLLRIAGMISDFFNREAAATS